MSGDNNAAIALLRSIDASLKEILALSRARTPGGGKPVASDRELDGKYGDPQVKFNPRDWTGPSCVGRRMSECPADFLDLIAETFDYFARKAAENDERTDKGKPVAEYKRADASRARGWAMRIRSGQVREPEPIAVGAEDWKPEGWD